MKDNEKTNNMYFDSVKQWNVIVGCHWNCVYCRKSFQAQMKRQKHNCIQCYTYEPHFHPERLHQSLPNTPNGSFIFVAASSDICFAKPEWMEQVLNRIRELPNKTFFFQSKDPKCFFKYDFPDNCILGITLETNNSTKYISKAPSPFTRYMDFSEINHKRKFVTIEPILEFDMILLEEWIREIHPERVYIGYDSKGNNLKEPLLDKTMELIGKLKIFTDVRPKLLRNPYRKMVSNIIELGYSTSMKFT